MYMTIQSDEDAKLLQQDLDKLSSWSCELADGTQPSKMPLNNSHQKEDYIPPSIHSEWHSPGHCPICQVPGCHNHNQPQVEPAHIKHLPEGK